MQPLIKGSQQYFKKVIAQSGAPSQTNSLEESIATTNDFMKALGCKTVLRPYKDGASTLSGRSLHPIRAQLPPYQDAAFTQRGIILRSLGVKEWLHKGKTPILLNSLDNKTTLQALKDQ